jgi:hypothetical protein
LDEKISGIPLLPEPALTIPGEKMKWIEKPGDLITDGMECGGVRYQDDNHSKGRNNRKITVYGLLQVKK